MPATFQNFGANVRFIALELVVPQDVCEVIAALNRFRQRRVRAIGSLHSCSGIIAADDVVMDLRRLNRVTVVAGPGEAYAELEAGCTINAALACLHERGYTLPTYGMIGTQTIGGAIATATHGSGRSSLSHYITAVSVAAYDPATGDARVYRWEDGDELGAARCGLGCVGVVLSVRIPVEPEYLIEEKTMWFPRIEDALGQAHAYPQQQFYLIPWSWRWFAQLRRPLIGPEAAPTRGAGLRRLFRFLAVDVAFNGTLRVASGTMRWRRAIRGLHRRVFALFARSNMRLVDRGPRIVQMRHDLYRHVEMELFVPEDRVVNAAAFVESVLRCCSGEALPTSFPGFVTAEFSDDVRSLRGSYVHDHAITFRRVLADETLISMTSGDEATAWYAISFVTYQRDLTPFLHVMQLLARAMASAFRARPHWGKLCPLDGAQLTALYPALPRFRGVCRRIDPGRVFVNTWAEQALGL